MTHIRYSFKSQYQYVIVADGFSKQCHVVDNPKTCNDFNYLIDNVVVINGMSYIVKFVEVPKHGPPWMEGENIGLIVEYLVQ